MNCPKASPDRRSLPKAVLTVRMPPSAICRSRFNPVSPLMMGLRRLLEKGSQASPASPGKFRHSPVRPFISCTKAAGRVLAAAFKLQRFFRIFVP